MTFDFTSFHFKFLKKVDVLLSTLYLFRKSDIMLKPLRCDFMTGPLTDQHSMEPLSHALEKQTPSLHEMLYYKKNGTGIWLEVGTLHRAN